MAELGRWLSTPYAIFTLVPILSVVAAMMLHRYRVSRARTFQSQHLFTELCRRHAIDAAGQRLLKQIAAGANLSQPAEIFILPGRFDAAAATAAKLRPKQREKLSSLRQGLFGEQSATLPCATTSSSSCPSLRSLPS